MGGPTPGGGDSHQQQVARLGWLVFAVLQLLPDQRQDLPHAARQTAADRHVRVVRRVHPAKDCAHTHTHSRFNFTHMALVCTTSVPYPHIGWPISEYLRKENTTQKQSLGIFCFFFISPLLIQSQNVLHVRNDVFFPQDIELSKYRKYHRYD